MNKVSAQLIYDSIPQSIDCDCGYCQLKDVEIARLKKLIQSMGIDDEQSPSNRRAKEAN